MLRTTAGRLRLVCVGAILVAAAAPASAQIGANPSGGAISHHALRARIDPSTARLEVVDTLLVLHRPAVPATQAFPILLARSLNPEKVEGLGLSIFYREARLRPRDFWDRPPYDELDGYERARTILLAPAQLDGSWPESVRVVLAYSGTVYDSLRAPMVAYARGFETTSGLIDPRGAFLGGASFWIPSRPEERFTFRCRLETPADWHGVSQGALVSSATQGDELRINLWECPQPMEEVYFVAGPYTLRSQQRDGIDVMTFTYADTDEDLCKRYMDGTQRYVKLYGGRIGSYPFAKFALIENFWQTGFGMPSFTLLGSQVIRLPFILDTSYGHEILHNWWGNGVFVDSRNGNWCEGLTTYGADYLYKEMQGPAEAREARRTTLQGYLDYVSQNEDRPLRLFREREDFATQAIGYGKSMMVFHQVRRLLGEDGFWGALQDFYREHLFHRASWDDLFEAFGRRAGKDLTGWKEQWLDRAGAPRLRLEKAALAGDEQDGYTVTARIAQEENGTPVPGSLYDLQIPVCVGWSEPPGDTTVVMDLSEAAGDFSVHVRRRPAYIAVDPDFDVLRRIDPAEIPPALSRTLGADTAVVVIADGLPPELAAAYESLAVVWDAGAKLRLLHEADFGVAAAFPELPAWLFGLGPLAKRFVAGLGGDVCRAPASGEAGWEVAGVRYPAGHGIVLAGGASTNPWTLIDGTSASQIAAIGRKLPHYGKYSYLVFENGTNTAKGSWEVRTSPLRASLVQAPR